ALQAGALPDEATSAPSLATIGSIGIKIARSTRRGGLKRTGHLDAVASGGVAIKQPSLPAARVGDSEVEVVKLDHRRGETRRISRDLQGKAVRATLAGPRSEQLDGTKRDREEREERDEEREPRDVSRRADSEEWGGGGKDRQGDEGSSDESANRISISLMG